jgi:hypothetical protein
MRKRLPLIAALVVIALAVALPFVAWIRQAPNPKVGTSFAAVRPTLQHQFDKVDVSGNDDRCFVYCSSEPDFFGTSRKLSMRVDKDLIIWVKNDPQPRVRPRWLDRALKAVGW